MNRGAALWGALAVISALLVTGAVVAVFPFRESRVVLPASIPLAVSPPSSAAVPIDLSPSVVGATTHASPADRGGEAAETPTSGDAGLVTARVNAAPRRPTSIGGAGGSLNADSGFAAGGRQKLTAVGLRSDHSRH
jgi:hypothetical protein